MTHRMNAMPTIRHGRTYYKPGPNDKNRGPLINICSVLIITGLLIVPPVLFWGSERTRFVRYVTLRHALSESNTIVELNHISRFHQAAPVKVDTTLQKNVMVHGVSSDISTIAFDSDTLISIPGALILRRTPEYCQWNELQTQSCQTCTRSISAKDGSTKDETYQCNCIIQYDYIKAWRSYRINSLLFDQPGAHYNPQRDPMPYKVMVGENVKLTFQDGYNDEDDIIGRTTTMHPNKNRPVDFQAILDPSMLSSGVRNQPYRRVEFTPEGKPPPPSFFSRLFSSILGTTSSPSSRYTRYEPYQSLMDMPYSPAAISDKFVYASGERGGYFFSPYESSTASRLFNLFAQYLEGSLFDWQIGDLMPSCTAGDVRFYYEVQDPNVVSVLGQVSVEEGGGVLLDSKIPIVISPRNVRIEGVTTPGEANEERHEETSTIGLVHSGFHSAIDMLIAEDVDSRNRAILFRLLLLLWCIPAFRVFIVALGRDMSASSRTMQTMGVLGVFCTMLGAVWFLVWGHGPGGNESSTMTWLFLFMGVTLLYISIKSALRIGGGGNLRRWNAVWCLIARWANLPPELRVEDSYIVSSKKRMEYDNFAHGEEDTPKKKMS